MLSQKNIKIKLKLNLKFFVDQVSAKFFGKKNFAGEESTLRRDVVEKFFAMCRWDLKDTLQSAPVQRNFGRDLKC